MPLLVGEGQAAVYDFDDNDVPGATERDRGYWRDVGTLDSYYEAHMDLISTDPIFNLYNFEWPILTSQPSVSAGEVRARSGGKDRDGRQVDGQLGRDRLRRGRAAVDPRPSRPRPLLRRGRGLAS